MLRMKAETRVLDCATPLSSIFLPLCLTDVRYTPSGSVEHDLVEQRARSRAGSRCSVSMISMRAISRALLVLERVDLLDLLVELRDLRLQQLVAPVLARRSSSSPAACASNGDERGEADGRADPDQELFPAPLALCFAPGQ